jgi:hypothetical protein
VCRCDGFAMRGGTRKASLFRAFLVVASGGRRTPTHVLAVPRFNSPKQAAAHDRQWLGDQPEHAIEVDLSPGTTAELTPSHSPTTAGPGQAKLQRHPRVSKRNFLF